MLSALSPSQFVLPRRARGRRGARRPSVGRGGPSCGPAARCRPPAPCVATQSHRQYCVRPAPLSKQRLAAAMARRRLRLRAPEASRASTLALRRASARRPPASRMMASLRASAPRRASARAVRTAASTRRPRSPLPASSTPDGTAEHSLARGLRPREPGARAVTRNGVFDNARENRIRCSPGKGAVRSRRERRCGMRTPRCHAHLAMAALAERLFAKRRPPAPPRRPPGARTRRGSCETTLSLRRSVLCSKAEEDDRGVVAVSVPVAARHCAHD